MTTQLAGHALDASLGPAGWVTRALGGSGGRTFLGQADRSVVVRFDADPVVLRRVAALGVGPEVLASGVIGGRSYAIQEHIPSTALTGPDLEVRDGELARLVGRFAGDRDLATLARPLAPADVLADAATRITSLAEPGRWRAALTRLTNLAGRLEIATTVASHGDPNATNVLAAANRLLLVDWDDLRTADPMRDLGQLAWWYLPRPRWAAFIEAAGVRWTTGVEARLFWWVAAESLDVALRVAPTDPIGADAFLRDAEAALAGQTNPRRPE